MKQARLPGVARPVGRCVLGTSGVRDERGYRTLDEFMAAGGTCIDTARVYGRGASEPAVGGWIARNQPEDLVIIGKGAHPPNCRPDAVKADLAQSLDRLGVPRIHVYLLHRDDPQIPVGEWVEALEAERSAGRIDAYGASNWSRKRVEAANEYAAAHGYQGMGMLSNHFSLAEPIEPLYPGCTSTSAADGRWLAESEIVLAPWSSQARGFFSDLPRELLDPATWRCWDTPGNRARRERARELADRRGVAPINIALAYVLNQPFATMPIIGPRDADELALALVGADLSLDEAELRWLAEGQPGRRRDFGGTEAGIRGLRTGVEELS